MPKRLIIDLDGTLAEEIPAGGDYRPAHPNPRVLDKLRRYKAAGFEIIIATSRNMRTYDNSIGKINARTLPAIVAWLDRHAIPYDEIHVGKPWCGHEGFYVDDKAIRPSEFRRLDYAGIVKLLADEKNGAE